MPRVGSSMVLHIRPIIIVAVGTLFCFVAAACGRGSAATPVELAEEHLACFNEGDLEGFLDMFADDTVIAELGTRDDPKTIAFLAFEMGLVGDAAGYTTTCEPWGEDGAKCEGSFHDSFYEPAGLLVHLTMVYQFDDAGQIARLGSHKIHDLADYQYERELAAWLTLTYPDLAARLTEYGLIRHSGAETIETLLPLVDEFIAQSPNWPKEPKWSTPSSGIGQTPSETTDQ